MEERHLSLSEAADALNISERTAYRWIKSGKLRAYKPGRDYWIPESAIQQVIEESVVLPKEEVRSSLEPTFNDALVEEGRARWEAAVLRARQLREHGRARMAELLAAWHERKDRQYLPQMAELLQEAYDAETVVFQNVQVGLDIEAHVEGDNPAWEEYREASHFYGALREMVEGSGLHVRQETVAHEVKAAA